MNRSAQQSNGGGSMIQNRLTENAYNIAIYRRWLWEKLT